MSPVKVSCKNKDVKYLEAKLSDGLKTARMVSFDRDLHSDMEKIKKKGNSVNCMNCSVKKSMGGGEYEVTASKKSKVMNSLKRFKIAHMVEGNWNEMPELTGIQGNLVYSKVCVKGKIVKAESVEEVESMSMERKFRKQECVLSDKCGSCIDWYFGKSWLIVLRLVNHTE